MIFEILSNQNVMCITVAAVAITAISLEILSNGKLVLTDENLLESI